MTIDGSDVSHHQSFTDLAAAKAEGNAFLIAKATEGTPNTFRDPEYTAWRVAAHNAGMVFGAYHFARPGDPTAQADFFLSVAALGNGEFPVLDMEDPAIGDMAAWSLPWAQRVIAALGTPPGIYLNQTYLANFNWQPLVDLGCWLWLAKYDGVRTGGPSGAWPFFAMKQFSDSGIVAGISSPLDRDSFQGTVDQLAKYTIGGGQRPTPPPVPPPVVVPHPAVLAWNLRPGNYYGNIAGPAASHGGVTAAERTFVKNIQQWLIYHGCVSGVAASSWATSRWADGKWQAPTDTAMSRWHARFYPGQPKPTQCWSDDYSRLSRA